MLAAAAELAADGARAAASALRETLASYRDKEDLITIGAYQRGADARIDYAIDKLPAIDAFLRQRVDEPVPAAESVQLLQQLMADGL